MQRYRFERRIPMFELEDPRRGREILEHTKRLLYNDAQEKIKELLETGEWYSFQVALVQPAPIDDFEMNTRIVLHLDTQRTTFAPQGVVAPPPVPFPFDLMAYRGPVTEDAALFQVGQQNVGQRIVEQIDDMARQVFVGFDQEGGDREADGVLRAEADPNFRRFLYGEQHEAKEYEDIETDFIDADIDAYGYFR